MIEQDEVVLRSGAVLRCGSDQNLWVTLDRQRVVLPYPNAGLGGGSMVVAPDERHAALFVFSGQTELGFELFSLVPALRHVGGLPYRIGESDPPKFSSDGSWLVLLVAIAPSVDGTDAEELLDPDADGEVVIDWAELVVQPIPDGTPIVVPVSTRAPASLDLETLSDWNVFGALELRGQRAVIRLPWGEVEVPIPPAGGICTPPWSP